MECFVITKNENEVFTSQDGHTCCEGCCDHYRLWHTHKPSHHDTYGDVMSHIPRMDCLQADWITQILGAG